MAKGTTTPHHWPPHVKYIPQSQYAAQLDPVVRAQLQGKPSASSSHTTSPPVLIRRITSPTHPAYPQNGLFASKKIPPNTLIIHYAGEIHIDERPSSDYDLSLFKATLLSDSSDSPTYVNVGIDAQAMGNEARFINDYRGTGVERPNAMFKEIYRSDGQLSMSIWSGKLGINKGEEILVSYGKGWWSARMSKVT